MIALVTRSPRPPLLVWLSLIALLAMAPAVHAAVITYTAILSGAAESPPT